MQWVAHIDGGPQRVNHAAAVVGHFIYSLGGCTLDMNMGLTAYIDVHALDTRTLRWFPIDYSLKNPSDIPAQCYGHTVVTYNGKLYLFGGRNDSGSSSTLYCFDYINKEWSRPAVYGDVPDPVDGHTSCVIDNSMYVFGGYEENGWFKRDLHRLNFPNFKWEKIVTVNPPPNGRDFHTAACIGNKMYIFGGRGHNPFSLQVERSIYSDKICYLDINTMKWEWPDTKGQTPCGRRSHSSFVYKNEMYIICGYNAAVDKHFNDMYKYNPEQHKWYRIDYKGTGPYPRRRQCVCVVNDKVYLFGGTSPCSKRSCRHNSQMSARVGEKPLCEHSDLHVLDIYPSLYSLCLYQVIQSNLPREDLPCNIRFDLECMTTHNNIDNN